MLAYITGTMDQELLLRNEYPVAQNRILKAQLKGRLSYRTASARISARLAIAWAARPSARWRRSRCRTQSWHSTQGSSLASSMDRGHVEPEAGRRSTEKLRN